MTPSDIASCMHFKTSVNLFLDMVAVKANPPSHSDTALTPVRGCSCTRQPKYTCPRMPSSRHQSPRSILVVGLLDDYHLTV